MHILRDRAWYRLQRPGSAMHYYSNMTRLRSSMTNRFFSDKNAMTSLLGYVYMPIAGKREAVPKASALGPSCRKLPEKASYRLTHSPLFFVEKNEI